MRVGARRSVQRECWDRLTALLVPTTGAVPAGALGGTWTFGAASALGGEWTRRGAATAPAATWMRSVAATVGPLRTAPSLVR